jgi:hypothetical protein
VYDFLRLGNVATNRAEACVMRSVARLIIGVLSTAAVVTLSACSEAAFPQTRSLIRGVENNPIIGIPCFPITLPFSLLADTFNDVVGGGVSTTEVMTLTSVAAETARGSSPPSYISQSTRNTPLTPETVSLGNRPVGPTVTIGSSGSGRLPAQTCTVMGEIGPVVLPITDVMCHQCTDSHGRPIQGSENSQNCPAY